MSDLAQLEKQLNDAKLRVKKMETIERLLKNPDFREIIRDDFCRDEVVRNVNLSGDPAAPTEMRLDCAEMARAGGHLERYMQAQLGMGRTAAKDIPQIEAEMEEVRIEEMNQ